MNSLGLGMGLGRASCILQNVEVTTLFYKAGGDTNPLTVANWFIDQACTIPNNALPTVNSNCTIQTGVCDDSDFLYATLNIALTGVLSLLSFGKIVTSNNGVITLNDGGGILNNVGTLVEHNSGNVILNSGNITVNNDAIQNNTGTVDENNNYMVVNNGVVLFNNGIIDLNNSTINVNNATVVANCGVITTNNGSVGSCP